MLNKSDLEIILYAALQYLGKPYLIGGEGPDGFDCSGLTRAITRPLEILPRYDTTAQAQYDYLKGAGAQYGVFAPGAFAFYGEDEKSITHVAILISPTMVIEAGGGDRTTKTVDDANKRNAQVRLSGVYQRSDLVSVLLPRYR